MQTVEGHERSALADLESFTAGRHQHSTVGSGQGSQVPGTRMRQGLGQQLLTDPEG